MEATRSILQMIRDRARLRKVKRKLGSSFEVNRLTGEEEEWALTNYPRQILRVFEMRRDPNASPWQAAWRGSCNIELFLKYGDDAQRDRFLSKWWEDVAELLRSPDLNRESLDNLFGAWTRVAREAHRLKCPSEIIGALCDVLRKWEQVPYTDNPAYAYNLSAPDWQPVRDSILATIEGLRQRGTP